MGTTREGEAGALTPEPEDLPCHILPEGQNPQGGRTKRRCGKQDVLKRMVLFVTSFSK